MFPEITNIQQHAGGNKENAGENLPERQHVLKGFVAVLGLRNHQTRQKGTQRQGNTDL